VTTIERPHQQENRLQSDPTVAKDDVHPSSPDGRLSVATWLAAAAISAALALAALAMCEYRFGTADQLQYLANVVEIENPGALGDDPYLRAFAALRSIFWYMIAAVSNEANRPAVCLAVSIGVAAIAAMLLMRLGTILATGRRDGGIDLVAGAAAALVLVVPKEQNWFGLVSLADVELTATSAVIPLVIGSMLAWTAGRPLASLLVALAAAPLHAQTAAYLLTTWVVVSLWSARRSPQKLTLPVAVGALGLVAVIRERTGNTVAAGRIDALEAAGRSMYPELLNPWLAPWTAWGAVLAILAFGLLAAVAMQRWGSGVSTQQRAAFAWGLASLFFPAVGLALLATGVRDSLLWRLMIGRSLMLPQIASLVFFASWAVMAMRRGGKGCVIAAIAFVLVSCWPFPAWPRVGAALGLAAVIAWMAFVAGWFGRERQSATPRFAAVSVAIGILVMGGIAVGRFAVRPHGWLVDAAEPSWRTAQLWARSNTAPGTRFLTPPHRAGWRLGAHRPTYGELNDGGLFFYAGEEVIEWAERMNELGASWKVHFAGASSRTFAEVLAQLDAEWLEEREIEYVVTEAGHDVQIGTVVWESPAYVIRRLR
jgi:hypothetical protein